MDFVTLKRIFPISNKVHCPRVEWPCMQKEWSVAHVCHCRAWIVAHAIFYLIENNTLIYIWNNETVSGDILLANGVQNRRKSNCTGTFNIDVQRDLEKTTVGDFLDGKQTTLPQLNDETYQSSVKKVSIAVLSCVLPAFDAASLPAASVPFEYAKYFIFADSPCSR